MPRHDWFNDDTMSRDRSEMRERDYGEHEGRRRSAMFDRDRSEIRERDSRGMMGESRDRSRHEDRDRERGWGGGERMHQRDEERRFGADDYNRGIPMDETERLIASNKVEGTPVYDRHGEKLGTIHNFMVEKRKGQVVYAVLKHGGGFLGLNERYYPLEWNELTYDTRLGGYHTDLDDEDLKRFGSFDSEGRWHSRSHEHPDRDRGREHGRERSMREPW